MNYTPYSAYLSSPIAIRLYSSRILYCPRNIIESTFMSFNQLKYSFEIKMSKNKMFEKRRLMTSDRQTERQEVCSSWLRPADWPTVLSY